MADGIYEITQKMNSDIQNDLTEITAIVNDYFRKKYFDKLKSNVNDYQTRLSAEPSREVQLLSAMKAYVPEEKRAAVDKAVNALTLFNTFNVMAKDFNIMKNNSQKTDSSVKPDGVYDIDENCTKRSSPSPLSVQELLFVLFAAGAL